ncbi:diaminopimelate epimerase, partial [Candidatus Omnitrophota bacterium]
MNRKLCFTKIVASGNDFVVIDQRKNKSIARPASLAVRICDRKFGVGADGLLLMEKSPKADVRMRIFNPDGSEPDMCGNGIRCAAVWMKLKNINIETRAR